MNILIICSNFPPDLSIGAIRPYMFAKYLSEFGHNVTVICSKKPSDDLKDKLYNPDLIKANVIFFDDHESVVAESKVSNRLKFSFLSGTLYNIIAKIYHRFFYFKYFNQNYRIFKSEEKKIIYCIDTKLHENYDIIFATFPRLENLYSGIYARNKFNSKIVIDFRDAIVGSALENWYNNNYMLKYEKELVYNADYITCVANDLSKSLKEKYGLKNIEIVNNGFDEIDTNNETFSNDNIFRICYTGGLKLDCQQHMLDVLLMTLKKLVDNSIIKEDLIEFRYAGIDSKIFEEILGKYRLSNITKNYGLVTRDLVYKMQNESDLFVTLSMNTKKVKGIISGKFYEGIRTKKAILTLVDGNEANSELYQMNEKYKYGFCYENANKVVSLIGLEKFLIDLYTYKVNNRLSKVYISDKLYLEYMYKNIAKKLEQVFLRVLSNTGEKS